MSSDVDYQGLRDRVKALEQSIEQLRVDGDPVFLADQLMELAKTWGEVGQPHRSAALFQEALTLRKNALGHAHADTVNAGLSAAAALKLSGQDRPAWLLVQALEKRTPQGHAERAHVVAVYNQLKPPGYRPAKAGGKAGKKKRRG